MEPDKLIDSISNELNSAFKSMAKAKTVDEKVQYSQIINNLCQSLGVFLDSTQDLIPFDFEDDE